MRVVFIAAGIIIIDFVTKLIASSTGKVTYNTGLTFGINLNKYLAVFLTAVILAVVFFYFFKNKNLLNPAQNFGAALIIGGALSNFTERIIFGHVTDFIYLAGGIFNIADFAIFGGIIILVTQILSTKSEILSNN